MMKKIIITLGLFVLLTTVPTVVAAQCPMCKASVESSLKEGNVRGKGLNNGILYLLATPYLVVASIGFLWYRKYRKKNVSINMRNENIHLN